MPHADAPELTESQGQKAFVGLFMTLSVCLFLWPLLGRSSFSAAMHHGWWGRYAMGFMKFFAIGTLGELYKKKWTADRLFIRAIVWGIFGMWITVAFLGFNILVDGMVEKHVWFNFWIPFWKSFWINFLGGYAWTMMLAHDYANFVIASGGHTWSMKLWAAQANTHFLLYFIPLTFIFWLVAHTGTFSLPPEYQPLAAAALSFMLGVFQSWVKRSPTPTVSRVA